VLETLRGRSDAARRMIASSRRMVEELGIWQRVLEADLFAGLIELLERDAAAAERWLRTAYDGLRAQGLGIDAAQAAALLGRALLAQGRVAEAEAVSMESESLAGDSFKAAIAWRGVRAEALAARGEHAAAIELARAAVAIAAATDDLLDHADARQALAVALRAAGRSAEADAEEKRAIELWEAKGATLLAQRARRRFDELTAGQSRFDRRAKPNSATEDAGRLDAVIAAKDSESLPSAARFANAASRVMDRFERCWLERDWDGMVATLAPAHRLDDRRRLVGMQMSAEESVASLRFVFEVPTSRFHNELLAARGHRLALFRVGISGQVADSGLMSTEHLQIVELDANGQQGAIVAFDLHDRGAAHAELDARYAVGEAARHARIWEGMRQFSSAFANRDWEAIAKRCAPDLVVHDRRLLGWETLHGPAAYLEALHSLVELAPDTKLRLDHVEICEHGYLVVTVWEGTREGGAYEGPSLMVAALDDEGRIRRFDQYDLERLEDARARYAELRTS
jgi:tetratricopeptide (TPR) repeat protein